MTLVVDASVLAAPAGALAAQTPPELVDGDLEMLAPIGFARQIERRRDAARPAA